MEPIREPVTECLFLERARNEAIKWLESRGVTFGPYRKIVIGRMGVLQGKEVGVRTEEGQFPFWRLRLDYDPGKGPHFNAEFGSGLFREKRAFTFNGTEDLIRALAKSLNPR
jgi:hypothetical protein